jgi:hypothetical protein
VDLVETGGRFLYVLVGVMVDDALNPSLLGARAFMVAAGAALDLGHLVQRTTAPGHQDVSPAPVDGEDPEIGPMHWFEEGT